MARKKKLKILLIEDNGMYLSIVSELLPGHEVIGAKTATLGLDKYIEFHPDITFLDIALPDGSGQDLLVRLRKQDKNAYVVMMTASRLKEDVLQSMHEGAQGYIIKPFASQMLEQCVKEYWEFKKGGK